MFSSLKADISSDVFAVIGVLLAAIVDELDGIGVLATIVDELDGILDDWTVIWTFSWIFEICNGSWFDTLGGSLPDGFSAWIISLTTSPSQVLNIYVSFNA